jgi:hypothetical protein
MGGYSYPILDWFCDQMGGSTYQILKCNRPSNDDEEILLETVLVDPNTLYAYPDGSKITIVQFDKWDNTTQSLSDLGVEIELGPKMFKRLKTFNRRFRSFYSEDRPVKVLLIDDAEHCSYRAVLDPQDKEKLFDGAFILSPTVVGQCMENFDFGITAFSSDKIFETNEFNRNVEVGNYYKNSKIFNARIFGPIEICNEGDPEEYAPFVGAIKGQAYTDHSGICEHYGVDVIAPYSAFKKEVNISNRAFFLIEPQNAKLGQMFSDGQTIVNLPALYHWKHVRRSLKAFYEAQFDRLVNNEMLEQWSDMSFAMFDPQKPKMFNPEDIATLTTWNVRAWIMCGGYLSHSPWLFSQMGKNFLASMKVDDDRKMRFPVPCAARALVITESLLRGLKGLQCDGDDFYQVESGVARWDEDLSVLVVNDLDYIEMYPSHGGCDLDDFFQIYWRTINGEKVIVVTRSPNDWGEYSIFRYHEGDWFSRTTYDTENSSFPEITSDPSMWPKRLSHAIADGDIEYTGLPEKLQSDRGEVFDAHYILSAISETSDSAASVGINVNARQLWSSTMRSHRAVQVCSMEDAIDTGVQGGNDAEVQAVISEGQDILAEIIASGESVDAYLWAAKHSMYHKGEPPQTKFSNFSYLQKVRMEGAEWFKEQYETFADSIVKRVDYSNIHALGAVKLSEAVKVLKWYRRSLYQQNNSYNESPNWEQTAQMIVRKIDSYEPGHERNSFVVALYSAALIVPLSTGKVSDQFVMQPQVFPYLMEALQFYGILGRLVVNDQGALMRSYETTWEIFDTTNNVLRRFDNALECQRAFFNIPAEIISNERQMNA